MNFEPPPQLPHGGVEHFRPQRRLEFLLFYRRVGAAIEDSPPSSLGRRASFQRAKLRFVTKLKSNTFFFPLHLGQEGPLNFGHTKYHKYPYKSTSGRTAQKYEQYKICVMLQLYMSAECHVENG
ncbi:hypothetical protein Zmor_023811 [Zophobas morio]|uniref:Uncharacterized protein n=1 Tax=Zophobas morio TaxID=2755281 RepID=A0AA38HZ06_9CUCU|nr:hypothetical protein Zmor_023811 [Zophobas morio]